MEEKHKAMREEAQQEKEEEKKLLMTVSPMLGFGVSANKTLIILSNYPRSQCTFTPKKK